MIFLLIEILVFVFTCSYIVLMFTNDSIIWLIKYLDIREYLLLDKYSVSLDKLPSIKFGYKYSTSIYIYLLDTLGMQEHSQF